MATNEEIKKEADYYLNNDVTIEQASNNLGISKRTLQLHFKKLESIDPKKYTLVQEKKERNILQGNILGGKLGKRKSKYTKEDANEMAKRMIMDNFTYNEASKKFQIPSSTLQEVLNSGLLDKNVHSMLYALSIANQKGIPLTEYLKTQGIILNLENIQEVDTNSKKR